jgi:hypothetical protein
LPITFGAVLLTLHVNAVTVRPFKRFPTFRYHLIAIHSNNSLPLAAVKLSSNNLSINRYLPQLKRVHKHPGSGISHGTRHECHVTGRSRILLFPRAQSDRCVKLRLRMHGGTPPQLQQHDPTARCLTKLRASPFHMHRLTKCARYSHSVQ